MAKRLELARELALVAGTFRVKVDDPMIEGYWIALAGFSLEAIHGAACDLIKTSRYMPRPVEWVEACQDWQWRKDHTPKDPTQGKLEQSNEPPLSGDEVRRRVGDLAGKLGWRPKSEPVPVRAVIKQILPDIPVEEGERDGG